MQSLRDGVFRNLRRTERDEPLATGRAALKVVDAENPPPLRRETSISPLRVL